MAQYCDPISYNFSFEAITENAVEPALKAAFREVVLPFKDCILDYAGFGGPMPKGFEANSNFIWIMFQTKDNAPLDVPSTILCPVSGRTYDENELRPAEVPREDAEAFLLAALNALDDPRCYCAIFDTIDKHSRRRYYCRPTKLGKQLGDLIAKPIEITEQHREELFRLLSCPSEDLSDVRIPAAGLYGEDLFNVAYRQWTIPIPNKELIADIPKDGKEYILHEISVSIPRFLVGENMDIPSIQRLWTKKLCELGNLFRLCFGSVDMDQSHSNYINAFERVQTFRGKIYLSDRIPGYTWAMLINATQRKKLDIPASDGIPGFYKTAVFDNGNLFFQKTADMRFMTWEDCHSLREYFKPSLTPAALEHYYQHTFLTYRAGFLPEELNFDTKLTSGSDFCVFHDEA